MDLINTNITETATAPTEPAKDKYRDIKQIAADVRASLKKEFPKCKFSVSIERYSMGQSMTVALMSAPFEPFASTESLLNGKAYAQLNQYTLKEGRMDINNGHNLTAEAFETMRKAVEIANGENWDNSDSMTDYFDVNYYLHVHIGRWNKPFVRS